MIKSLTFFLTIGCAFSSLAQDYSLADLDSADYFNFWEGEWNVSWTEGENRGEGTNSISWKTGGKVLEETFEITKGQNKGVKGTSISVFQPKTQTWRQAWADNQGGYFDFIGAFEGDKRMFKTHPRDINGKVFIQRMVFYDIKKDSFTWDWESSNDGGETWTLNWKIDYERKK